jgi:hypothetical protein
MFKYAITAFLIAAALAVTARATALGDLANSMSPKQWRELTTVGFTSNLLWIDSNGGADCVFNYSDDLTWYNGTREVYYIGGSHYGPGRFIIYNDSTNTWRRNMPSTAWLDRLGHGYDHNAVDQKTGIFFHHEMNARLVIHRWSISAKRWLSDFLMPLANAEMSCCHGDEFFPEFRTGGLIVVNGSSGMVLYCNTSTAKWDTLGAGLDMATYHNIAKYDPKHKLVYLGGGNGTNTLYKLDTLEALNKIAAAPIALGINSSATTVDPVTGDILAVGEDGNFYSYNLESNVWKTEGQPPTNSLGGANRVYMACGPVNTYGVTLWCKYAGGTGKVWLYKHAQPAATEAPPAGFSQPFSLSVSPNPFRSSTTISVSSLLPEGGTSLAAYDVNGKRVRDLSGEMASGSGSVRWETGRLPAGIYIISASAGKVTRQERIVLLR